MAVAVAVPFGVVQLLLSVELQVTVGFVVLSAIIDSHVAVHPEVISVAVTMYVPADRPACVASVPPLLHT